MEEKIRHLEEENKLKNKIIELYEEKIKYLEEKISNKNNEGILIIKNLPINRKFIFMSYNNKKYVFISHRHEIDIINNDNTKLAIFTNFTSSNTQVKWIFSYKKNNIATIIFDIENGHQMFNWRLYSDGKYLSLSRYLESLFEIIMIDSNKFYIRDLKTGKF